MRIRKRFFKGVGLLTAIFLALILPVAPPIPAPVLADGELAVIRVSEIDYRGGLPADGAWFTFGLPLAEDELGAGEKLQVGDVTQTDVKSRYPDGSVKFAIVSTKIFEPGDYAVTKADAAPGPGRRKSAPKPGKPKSSTGLSVPASAIFGGGRGGPDSEGQPKIVLEVWRGEESTTYSVEIPDSIPEFPNDDDWWLYSTDDDWWLHPEDSVFEWRHILTPEDPQGNSHDYLRAYVDIRLYGLDVAQVRVTMANTFHEVGNAEWYKFWIETAWGEHVNEHPGLTHPYLTRAVFLNETYLVREGEVVLAPKVTWTWDPEPGIRAKAFPRYDSNVVDPRIRDYFDPQDPRYDVLGEGYVDWYMPGHGERDYGVTSPALDRAGARFVAHPDPDQQAFVLKQADLAGSWPVHVSHMDDGEFISIDPPYINPRGKPFYWMDERAEEGDKPAGNFPGGCGRLLPDLAHQASWAYLGYLMTGDRYYAEEVAFWANDAVLRTWNDRLYKPRGENGEGWIVQPWNDAQDARDVRTLMRLAEPAFILPTDDVSRLGRFRSYIQGKLENNLRKIDTDLQASFPPFGPHPYSMGGYLDISPYYIYSCSWITESIAATLHFINRMGFSGGEDWQRDQAAFKLAYFDPANPDMWNKAGPYRTPLGERNPPGGPVTRWLETIEEIADAGGYSDYKGFYGVHVLAMLKKARALGMKGAEEPIDYIQNILEEQTFCCLPGGENYSDLGNRAEWAIDDSSYED